MNKIRNLLLLLLLVVGLGAFAQTIINNTFAGAGTVGTTLSYFIGTANNNGGVPRLQYINATSDKAGSKLQFYTAASPTLVTATQSVATNILTMVGTGYASNDVVVVRHTSLDTYERAVVTASTATNLTVSANLGTKASAGDLVYLMSTAGSIAVGAATKELNSNSGIYNGERAKPFLITLDGTSACQINAAAGVFEN